jgi:hypothetical protein
MTDVFDGMADIFADVFGCPVVYTPIAGGSPATINAIWWETPLTVTIGEVAADARQTQLSVRAVDVPDPQEGDTATRVSDGKVMTVTTPIQPDGKGIIVCNLADP